MSLFAGLFTTAPRLLSVVAGYTLDLLVLSAGFGAGLAWLTQQPSAEILLGTTPGGIAEMGLTAAALGLSTPTVVLFHLVQMLAVLLTLSFLLKRMKVALN